MFRSNSIISMSSVATLFLAFCLFPSIHTVRAESDSGGSTPFYSPVYSPVVNGEALRGLSTVGSAETMGAGRITFSFLAPWYKQQIGYFNTPNAGASLFTGAGAFSYGVNPNVDIFGSIVGFASSNYSNTSKSSGLGTIQAGAQGSLPFARSAFVRMGGQVALIGGTSQNQINMYRADGYNYLDTRNGYDLLGKFMQTFRFGSEDLGVKLHLNEGGVFGISQNEPSLLLLGAGLQANMGFAVLGAEINSRTIFHDMSFGTDPLWFTPTLHIRTPYQMNVMAGVDVSLSADRPDNAPRALEPYRVFGALAFSFDMLKSRRNAEFARKQKAEQEKLALENNAAQSAKKVQSLTIKSAKDSIALAKEKENGLNQKDSMQNEAAYVAQENKNAADLLAKKATADSLALILAARNLAEEKLKRSDAEKQLLSTGELLLDAVYFKTGETIISINSKPYLNIIGIMLLKYPKLQIEVAGHTDNIGDKDYNITLSQGRAEAVRDYLTEVAPALSLTLFSHGYGMSMPKADNGTKEGRLANRRVELRVINKDALQQYSLMW
ncbi:MAG: OmpA family protein [Chitinispirillaceae bacterium]|jgi:outer membrane protein OmpA-like peptidoglycan-associated protein